MTTWIGLWQSPPSAICLLWFSRFQQCTPLLRHLIRGWDHNWQLVFSAACFNFSVCAQCSFVWFYRHLSISWRIMKMNNECLQWPNHFVLGTVLEELLLQIDCPSAHSWEHSQDDNWREEGQDWRWWWLWMSMIIVATIMMMLTTIIGR